MKIEINESGTEVKITTNKGNVQATITGSKMEIFGDIEVIEVPDDVDAEE